MKSPGAVHDPHDLPDSFTATVADPQVSAKEAGLRYVSGDAPGISRKRSGKSFIYFDAAKKRIRDQATLDRIRGLVLPPAWEKVWICASERGHLQATGYDARGRRQYRYHPAWRKVRDGNKFGRMIAFGKVLPALRRRVRKDMKLPGLPRQKVIATLVKLLETTLIRIGNEEYTRENHSYGLTTLRNRHVKIGRAQIHFEFRGKSGVHRTVDLQDKRLARIVRRCQELPGDELFQYLDDDGRRHSVDSSDVNEYLKSATGQDFTAKDFRTWAGTVLAAMALQEFQAVDSEAQAKKNIVAAIESVARRLGNTKAVCRKCYVHPAIIDSYVDGTLVQVLRGEADRVMRKSLHNMKGEEAAVLTLLRNRLKLQSANSRKSR